ncbi:MAG: hypothetical protein CFE43_11660 [Burkholderiales bacterium PBB3]|nr:MAG: hypothetical protein CFE43_11660 [Burkholderiales bacterium PBB3]
MVKFYEEGFDPDDLNIRVSELLVATADASDTLIDRAVADMLVLLKDRMKMDVVFVSEFVDGKQVFRYVDAPQEPPVMQEGDSDLLERTWCQRVVDGRLPEVIPNVAQFAGKDQLPPAPFDIGTYLSTPVLLGGGQVYGTLCCLSFSPLESVQERDLKNLRSVAQLVAKKIDMSQTQEKAMPVTFSLVPK